ncbi:hypothetical protein Godav_005746 [Gossypium davidsonii]|uniref:Diphthamide biosynthesis protein 3 n=1 Tax=Gossypium davidsonii TaxID=34287 RepID=A0A7J8S1K0_GOSDV|nr:hypothetical protein [Gossypium davidsonii]
MSYDDVEIEDMQWNEELQAYTYPCPCGDLFQITKEELKIGEEIARCPSCSLYITVIYNAEDFADKKSNNNLEPPKRQAIARMFCWRLVPYVCCGASIVTDEMLYVSVTKSSDMNMLST